MSFSQLAATPLTPGTAAAQFSAHNLSPTSTPFWEAAASAPCLWPSTSDKKAPEKETVQPEVTSVINTYFGQRSTLKSVMIDGHEVVTLPPKRKPDIPVYWAPKAPSKAVLQKDDIVPSAYYLVAVGEVKGRTSRPTGFSAEELGLLEAFLRNLLINQSYRKIALGFLTDGNIIQFLWLRVAPDRTFSANLSAPYDLRQNDTAGPGLVCSTVFFRQSQSSSAPRCTP